MRLKSLEMSGFKSFTERTLLQFTPGITAIVGPNGCGKSNIVDALRWVMGEQSARHLRGHLMEDVIFNGSENVSPTGMAEVSLVFDNEDGRGPAQYSGFSEIMVTRRLFRSGESEYCINKVSCRLKDIIELFLGTGVGNKAYSIVEQGRVDEMINAKPEERRALIEEAAGTSKYKSRKLAAERKLERTEQNLLRVNDVVREIERQIRSMELQAKKAERYRSLREELRQKELAWTGFQLRTFDDEISRHEATLNGVEDQLTGLLASLHSQEADGEGLKLLHLESDREIASIQEAVYRQKMKIQGEEQKIHFYRKDLAELRDDEKKHEAEVLGLQSRLGALSHEIDGLKRAQEDVVQLSLFEESRLHGKEKDLAELRIRMQGLQSEMESDRTWLIEASTQISHLRNERLARERRREEIQRQLARSEQESAAAIRSRQFWKDKQQERKGALERSSTRAKELTQEIDGIQSNIEAWGRVREDLDRKIGALKEQLQEHRSQIVSLEALHKNYEGYQEGVRSIMLQRRQEASLDGIDGLVAEIVEAPEPYEKALTAVLGDRLQYIIVRSHDEGIQAIEYLKRESSGRGSFIPRRLSRLNRRPLPLGEPEVVGALLELVSVKSDYREVGEYLLADVVVVRDLKSGLDLWNRNGFVMTLVTPEGEVIDPMGVVTGGSSDSLKGSLLFQKRRMKELAALSAQLEVELQENEIEASVLRERIDKTEARKSAQNEEAHRLQLDRIRLEHELLQADQEVARTEDAMRTFEQEQADLLTTLHLLEMSIQDSQSDIEKRLREKEEKENSLAARQTDLAQGVESLQKIEAEVTESRIRTAALGEKKENTQVNLEDRLKVERELSEQIRTRQSQIIETKQKLESLTKEVDCGETSLEEDRKTLVALEARLTEERQKYQEVSRRLARLEETAKELRSSTGISQEEKNRLQLVLTEKKMGLQHLLEGVRQRYDIDLRGVPPPPMENDVSVEELSLQIEELRSRVDRMGEVNLAAIGEFEELNSRYQFLSRQKADLEKSIADLRRTIAKLNRVCRLRFKESFDQISQRFEEIFPRLFRGGRAKLILTDENDYLETGVDIVAQPPGKKLQAITLLSGGEKALTAVSLLFAIFLTKPSPFCFLDEVDAPLDDANIDRFNEMVREMSQSSQFIFITHNKRSMQSAEVLYGITMAEPGVSNVVSVRMN
jgi:chromosome segregation protein